MRNLSSPFLLASLTACLLTTATPSRGDETVSSGFAVESEVKADVGQAPLSRTTTLLLDEEAYDVVQGNPPQVARFGFRDQFVDLIDRQRRVRTRLLFADIVRYDAELRTRAKRRGQLGAFLAEPSFAQEFDATQKTFQLSSPWLTYQVVVADAPSDVVEQLTRFADWSSRLATMLTPLAPPAAARLKLNAALKKQNWRAERVVRRGGEKAKKLGVMVSQHRLRSQLTNADLELIRGIKKELHDFPLVSFSEFRRIQVSAKSAIKK